MKKVFHLIGEAQKMAGFEIIKTGQQIVIDLNQIELIRKHREKYKQDVDENYKIEYYDLVSIDGIHFDKSEIKKTIEYQKLRPISFAP